jgi:hypothetical protein
MAGLEGIHECTVELTVTTGGKGHNGLLNFTASAWIPTVEAHQTKELGKVTGRWPNKVHPTLDNAVFNALYDLDRVIGRNYSQAQLPE